MLTRRGWALIVGAFALAVGGRVLGLMELFVLATGGAVAVVGALVLVRFRPPALDASRRLHPSRVYAGADCRVELIVTNTDTHRSPVVTASDPLRGPEPLDESGARPATRGRSLGQARFGIAPVGAGETIEASYRLPTTRRGVFTVGPLDVRRTDPLGLATAVTEAAPPTQLTVYPRVDDVAPLPQSHGHDPHAASDRATALGSAGEEFYGLRAYQLGDDLRRVHWPSTARLDELMIRQHEVPWQGRATVLLDDRQASHTEASFETAVSAAASVLAACWRRRWMVRLVTTDGIDSRFVETDAQVDAVMERLAIVETSTHDRLASVLNTLRPAGDAGALAVITTAQATVHDLQAVARVEGGFGSMVVVLIERSAMGLPATGAPPPAVAAGTIVVRVNSERPFAAAWNSALIRRTTAPLSGQGGWR